MKMITTARILKSVLVPILHLLVKRDQQSIYIWKSDGCICFNLDLLCEWKAVPVRVRNEKAFNMYIHIYIWVCVYMFLYAYIYMYMYVCVCMYIHILIYIYIYLSINEYVHIHIYI